MGNLKASASAAEMMLALEKENGSKISSAWGPAPAAVKLSFVSQKVQIGEDGKPTAELRFKCLESDPTHGMTEGDEYARPVPVWLLQRLKKMGLDKAGSKMAVGFFGQGINAQTKLPVNDFRILALV